MDSFPAPTKDLLANMVLHLLNIGTSPQRDEIESASVAEKGTRWMFSEAVSKWIMVIREGEIISLCTFIE